MSDLELVQRVYREFSTAPLTTPEQDNLYVSLDEVRGGENVVSRLAKAISLAEGNPTCQVLAGHKGSGKSTEILRLKKWLQSKVGMFVVYVQLSAGIDLYDVQFPEVLIAMIRQLAEDLRRWADVELKPNYFTCRLEEFGELLTSEVNLKSFELSTGLAKVAMQLKASPNMRTKIREAFDPAAASWLDAANDVIGQAMQTMVRKGRRGLVFLVDDLDKMDVHQQGSGDTFTDEYLFVNRATQLTGFMCHVVYTIPLSLAYSHHEQTIKNYYGGNVPVVPMTKIYGPPPDGKPFAPGIEKFRDIVVKRLSKAEASLEMVFRSPNILGELIALSGGQPTELMTLIREAIISGDLPIDHKALERAKVAGRREYARQLRAEHWPILNEIRETGNYTQTKKSEAPFRELLRSRAILQYVNDIEWYGLNPMVAALKPLGQT